ncbi:methyl-accepting chemotaxis protein [Aquitalea denitrificans]|uniref:methyl-accepting chemotaxis protein n=1 Tax=Aquitalea denitrificans TaxID=519081 RepID=UPI00135CBF27|nr:methyl-accepting chemotaxis protein [Aquitalea denitrificans]
MKLTIAQRLSCTLLVCLIAILTVAGFAYRNMRTAQEQVEYIDNNVLPSIQLLYESTIYGERLRINIRDYMLAGDASERTAAGERLQSNASKVEEGLNNYAAHFISDEQDKQLLATDKSLLKLYLNKTRDIQAMADASNMEGMRKEISQTGEFRNLAMKFTEAMENHVAYNNKTAKQLTEDGQRNYHQALNLFVTVIVLAILVAGGLGFMLVREIRQRMQAFRDGLRHVARELDFTQRIKIHRQDELGNTAEAFNKLLDTLQSSLQSVKQGALTIAGVSTELASTATQVATAAQHQSSASSNMAATVEEMTVSVNHVADRASEANTASVNSGELAEQGKATISKAASDIQYISRTVDTAATQLRGLEEKSQQVSRVVQVIRDVADQTNLLALNAAIEAARAGEQGRGFAVVADEVRKLAERTAQSTQEISSTITAILESAEVAVKAMGQVEENVADGVRGAAEANASIIAIGSGSQRAVALVDEITNAIKEQSVATTSIAQQVEGIAQMAEESSAAAGNTANSAQQLDSLSRQLQSIVDAYKI